MRYSAVDQDNQSERIELSRNEKIGEGATAFIYKAIFKNQIWAAKIFKEGHTINAEKIQSMLHHQPDDLIVNIDGEDFIQFAWVKYVIKNSIGNIIGFLMPYISHDDTFSLDTFYDPVLSKRLKPYEAALTLRVQLALNLCELIENLHKNKHFFIDIKPQNIRVYKKNHNVVLLDCDGYSICNKNNIPNRFPADLISTDYIAPEVTRNNQKPSTLGIQQDLYGLSVILFQLFNRGTHPFQGITTDKNISASTNDERASLGLYAYGLNSNQSVKPRLQSFHNLLLDETRYLFDKSFETQSRTTATEWVNHFNEILNNKKFETCEKIDKFRKLDKDIVHIKFTGKDCIGCKLESEKKPSKITKRNYNIESIKSDNKLNSNPISSSQNIIYTPVNKPDEFNFSKFFFYALIAIFVVVLVTKCTDQTTNNYPSSSSIANNSISSTAVKSCDVDLKSSTVKQLCDAYWSKNSNYDAQCNLSVSNEIKIRGFQSFPEKNCGLQLNLADITNVQKTIPPIKIEQQFSNYAALFTSLETRAVGYSIDYPSENEAITNAKLQCQNQALNNISDNCIKLISGVGRCLAISRASNGAMGVQISNDKVTASKDALKSCKDHGGLDCPYPKDTLFCAK